MTRRSPSELEPPAWGPLRRFARRSRDGAAGPARCELCAAALGERHGHVLELARRAVQCACPACAVLFADAGAAGGRYRTVPDRVLRDPTLHVTTEQWGELGIPVRLAYVVRERAGDGPEAIRWTAFYPSPAGPTQAEPSIRWAELIGQSPLGRALEPDVEALLVHRAPGAGPVELLLVPVTVCFELVAGLRSRWRGFDGGDEARQFLDGWMTRLRDRAGDHPTHPGGP